MVVVVVVVVVVVDATQDDGLLRMNQDVHTPYNFVAPWLWGHTSCRRC